MLTCREITERVTDYLDRRLPAGQRIAFKLHLGRCDRCRAYLAQMRTTVRVLRELPEGPSLSRGREQLMARFRATYPPRERPVPATIRLLAGLEQRVGGRRGWVAAALLLFAALVALPALGLQPGPLADGAECLATELIAGLVPAVALAALAATRHARLSAGALLSGGMAGSLAAFAALQAACPDKHVAPHVLGFHLGGMIAAGLAALAVSRWPALR